jgi:hypothetical protein
MSEKLVLPEVTSGTLEIVFAVAEQVMSFWIAVTTSATSAGRTSLPTMKQAFVWRVVRAGRAVAEERRLRRLRAVAVEVRILGLWWWGVAGMWWVVD